MNGGGGGTQPTHQPVRRSHARHRYHKHRHLGSRPGRKEKSKQGHDPLRGSEYSERLVLVLFCGRWRILTASCTRSWHFAASEVSIVSRGGGYTRTHVCAVPNMGHGSSGERFSFGDIDSSILAVSDGMVTTACCARSKRAGRLRETVFERGTREGGKWGEA